MTDQELQELCRLWQKRLRLQDWIVKVRIARAKEFAQEVTGNCTWVSENRTALIKILDPIDYDSACILPQDIEKTLVHELVHLYFAPFHATEGPAHIAQEQALDAIAGALVKLARGGKEYGEKEATAGERGEIPKIEVELS